AAAGQTHGGKLLHVAQESKGARRSDLLAERLGAVMNVGVALETHRVWVKQRVVDRETIGRLDGDRLSTFLTDRDPSIHDDLLHRAPLLHDAGALDQLAELARRSIHNRDLTL